MRGHRQHFAVARVERDDRARVRIPVALVECKPDPVGERVLSRALQLGVQGQPQSVPRDRLRAKERGARRPAERVDAEAREPRLSAQELVVRTFDPALADAVAEAVAAELLQLILRDLADLAEQLSRQGAVAVAAYVRVLDADAGELRLALLEELHLGLGRSSLDRDGRDGIALVPLDLPRDV